MVVFGAGASYDSDDQRPAPNPHADRPPLANQLFNPEFGEIQEGYKGLSGMFARLRALGKEPGTAIERRLQELADAAGDSVARHRLITMRSYLRDVVTYATERWLHGAHLTSTYAELLDRVDDWRRKEEAIVVLATFNYDTLVESACSVLDGMPRVFQTMDDYTRDGPYRVLKLHGSVDWVRLLPKVQYWPDRGDPVTEAVSHGPLVLNDTFATVRERPPDRLGGPVWIPALAVPTISKFEFEMPARHRQVLVDVIPQVTHLLVIGWRAAETHFIQLWSDQPETVAVEDGLDEYHPTPGNLDRVLVVDWKEGAGKVVEALKSRARMDGLDFTAKSEGFSGFMRSNALVGSIISLAPLRGISITSLAPP